MADTDTAESAPSKPASKAAASKAKADRKGGPSYDLTFQEDIPEAGGRGRGAIYHDLFVKVQEMQSQQKVADRQWARIATFETATGAAVARNDIVKGTRSIPADVDGEGNVEGWEVEARRIPSDEDPTQTVSALFIKYTG